MLYDCWRQTARAYADQIALKDLPAGRAWTFGQLETAAENSVRPVQKVAFPQGASAEFILDVLGAWRAGQVVCPLEVGQLAPAIDGELPEGIVHLKTTSATTGTPRLVAFTAAQLMADAHNITRTMGLRPDWPNLGLISLAHSYGFSNLVLPLLLHGIPLSLAGATLPEALRRAAAEESAVTLAAVPALWRTWLDAEAIPSNVRLAISAGAHLPLPLEQSVFARQNLKIHNFYGSSECGGIAYDATNSPRADAACVGSPLSEVVVSAGEDGCIEVRSRAVAQRYWPDPSPGLEGGVFRTNDLGEICDGLVYVRGRAGDQINVAGRKVAPEVIERVLAAHPDVRECLAFGIPSTDPQRGETIVACVAGDLAGSESLKQFAMTRLAPWQVPREWWFVDSLTVNHRGKLSRAQWRMRYLEQTAKQ
jgi:long-chain acyl-CoA synthetase